MLQKKKQCNLKLFFFWAVFLYYGFGRFRTIHEIVFLPLYVPGGPSINIVYPHVSDPDFIFRRGIWSSNERTKKDMWQCAVGLHRKRETCVREINIINPLLSVYQVLLMLVLSLIHI